VVSALVVIVALLALLGFVAAGWRQLNPNGAPVIDPKREPLPGARGEFGQLSPDGTLCALIERPAGESADQALVVVDAVRGRIVRRFPAPATGGSLRYAGWRSPTSVWVSAVELSEGRCIAAFSASAPGWELAPDDCSRRPESAGRGFEHRVARSPDGVLTARTIYERSRQGLMERRPISDVRLEDDDGRFLGRLGNLMVVGWAADSSLIVLGGSDHRPYRIARAEIDSSIGVG
jgi:hypothetical protein